MKVKEFFFTGFYSGYCPVAPGTAGTFVAMVIYILENIFLGNILGNSIIYVNIVIVLILIYPSIKLGDAAEVFFKDKDPQQVVLDEMMGYWIGILFIPFSFTGAAAAFLLFRLFDIIKPFPARNVESLKGGLGIMLDDYVAGIYTCICMNLFVYLMNFHNIILP